MDSSGPKPKNEKQRLSELQKYHVLDTEFEQAFDSLTKLASEICDVPISLVSLIDSDRQWFKSRQGLDAPETPRNISFCQYAILDDQIFEVQDASAHELVKDNPLVTGDPNIRFYAGAPLKTPRGYNIGTLCVIDRKPKELSAQQREALQALANQVVSLLELRLHTQNMLEAKREADAANQAKSMFLANMSHELRTPMNSIIGFTKRLIKSTSNTLSDREREALFTIDKNSQHLLCLINDVLDLSKIEAGKMELDKEKCNILELAMEAVEIVRPLADAKNLPIKADFPETVIYTDVDHRKMVQVFTNLLSNAIKFTDEGEVCVSLTLDSSIPDTPIAVIDVSDSGVGIKQEDLEKLFCKFEQLEKAANSSSEGTGLGLNITKNFVELHGGEIEVESVLRQGSHFVVRLPAMNVSKKQ